MNHTTLKNRQVKMVKLAVGDIYPMIVIILFLLLGPARAERHAHNAHHRRLRRSASGPSSALQPVQAERVAERITPILNPTLTRLPTTTINLISDATSIASALTQALGHSDTKLPPTSKSLTPAPDSEDPSQTHEVEKPSTLSEGAAPASQWKSASSTNRFTTSRTSGINLFLTLPPLVPPNGLLPTDLSPKPASHVETSLSNPTLTTSDSSLRLPTTRTRGPFSTGVRTGKNRHGSQMANPILATPTQKIPNGPPTSSRKGDNSHLTKPTQHPAFTIPLLSPIPPLLSDIPSAVSSITDHFPTPHEGENHHLTKPTQHPAFSIPLPSPIPSLLSSAASSVLDHFPAPHEHFPPKTLTSDKEESSSSRKTNSPLSTTRTSPPFFVPLSTLVSSVLSELSGLPSVIDNLPIPVNTATRKGSRTSIKNTATRKGSRTSTIKSTTTSGNVNSGEPDKSIVHTSRFLKPPTTSKTAQAVDQPSRITMLPSSHAPHNPHITSESPPSVPHVAQPTREKTTPPEKTTTYTQTSITTSSATPSSGGNATHPTYSALPSVDPTATPKKSSTPGNGTKPKGHPVASKKPKSPTATGTAEPTNKNLFFFGTQVVHPESVGGVVIGCSVVIYVLIMTVIYVFQRRRYRREKGIWDSPETIVRRTWWSRGRNYGRL